MQTATMQFAFFLLFLLCEYIRRRYLTLATRWLVYL